MSKELDAECARALGYAEALGEVPPFSTNQDAANALEDEIERRGLQDAYIDALIDATNTPSLSLDIWPSTDALWRFMHATPEQRARAFLAAIKD